MGLGNQAKGGLLVVVVVVNYAQVHGKDGSGCGGHLHGQCCRAHVHKMVVCSWFKKLQRLLLAV